MSAILLACLAGAAFGALAVAVRLGLARGVEAEAGAVAATLVATALAAAVSLAAGSWADGGSLADLWPFAAIGFLVPGLSQILFNRAIGAAGPSRAAIAMGTTPLLSALIAVAVLDERPNAAVAVGTVLVVAGGALLVWEPARPAGFRTVGLVLAFLCAVLFAIRDNVVRGAADGSAVPPLTATVTTLAAATFALAAYRLAIRGRRATDGAGEAVRAFLPAGIALGVAYSALVVAFDRGDVTVVAPLNATQSLWAVVLSALVLGRSELVGARLVAAAGLVVAGSALIGVFR
jgi:drug/metabolite transporter (DMT)-like permease